MTIIYDALLKRQRYEAAVGYVGEPKYTCIFYDEDRKKVLKEMQKYVKRQGFTTPDRQFTVVDIVLRERTATGKEISITPYYKLFDVITGELLKQERNHEQR